MQAPKPCLPDGCSLDDEFRRHWDGWKRSLFRVLFRVCGCDFSDMPRVGLQPVEVFLKAELYQAPKAASETKSLAPHAKLFKKDDRTYQLDHLLKVHLLVVYK